MLSSCFQASNIQGSFAHVHTCHTHHKQQTELFQILEENQISNSQMHRLQRVADCCKLCRTNKTMRMSTFLLKKLEGESKDWYEITRIESYKQQILLQMVLEYLVYTINICQPCSVTWPQFCQPFDCFVTAYGISMVQDENVIVTFHNITQVKLQ